MAMVPAGFEFSYNGYKFDPEHTHTTQMGIHPVTSKDGRTVIFSEFLIGVRTYVLGFPTDADVQNLVKRLSVQGAPLLYNGRSIGDLRINTGSMKRDVMYGPVPRPIALTFYGPRSATQIDWSCVVHLPTCDDAAYQFAAMDLSYTVEHRPRPNGRVDRVVSGELRIANNRIDPTSRRIMDSPDEWRSDVSAPVPERFRREWQPWKVDDSRTRLTFGWTDFEFGTNVYPPGIAWCEANHNTRTGDKGLAQYIATIDAEYLPAAGYPPDITEKAFAALVAQRFAAGRKQAGQKTELIPVSFEAKEAGIYSDTHYSYSLAYMYVSTLAEAIRRSGMWTPTDAKWSEWKNSMLASVLSPYGYSSLLFRPGDDLIVDLCGRQLESPGSSGTGKTDRGQRFLAAYPNPDSSWLSFENYIRVEADSGLAVFRDAGAEPANEINGGELVGTVNTLPGAPKAGEVTPELANKILGLLFGITPTGPVGPGGNLNPAMPQKNDFGNVAGVPTGKLEETRVQERAAPTCYIYMYGRAVRVGWSIPCPELTDVEGVVPRKDNRLDRGEGFACGVIGNAAVPVYGAVWNLRYFLDKIPAKPITPPGNPMFGA